MAARDFINEALLSWLEHEIAAEATGSKHYLAGFEDAIRAVTRFIEGQRNEWDVAE
jgi:hypothetical protein